MCECSASRLLGSLTPFRMCCCSWTTSRCQTAFFAFSRVRSASSYRRCESVVVVSNADHESVSNHLRLQRTVLAGFDESVQGLDVLLRRFPCELISTVEARPLEDHIFAHLEKAVKLGKDLCILFPVVFCGVC